MKNPPWISSIVPPEPAGLEVAKGSRNVTTLYLQWLGAIRVRVFVPAAAGYRSIGTKTACILDLTLSPRSKPCCPFRWRFRRRPRNGCTRLDHHGRVKRAAGFSFLNHPIGSAEVVKDRHFRTVSGERIRLFGRQLRVRRQPSGGRGCPQNRAAASAPGKIGPAIKGTVLQLSPSSPKPDVRPGRELTPEARRQTGAPRQRAKATPCASPPSATTRDSITNRARLGGRARFQRRFTGRRRQPSRRLSG